MDYTVRVTKQQYTRAPLLLRMLGTDHLQEAVNRPSGLPLWQILYGVSGSGHFRIEGRHFLLRKGHIALLSPHTSHSYESTGDGWVVHFLGFQGNSCRSMLADMKFRESGIYHPDSRVHGGRAFLKHMETMEGILRSEEREKYRELSKELYAMLLDLSSGCSPVAAVPREEEDGLVQELIGYMEAHFAEDIALLDLANAVHRTPEYLCTHFKKETGQTIGTFLRRLRIGRARILLMDHPDLTAQEVGGLCGFRSSGYFGKVFRAETGMTPQQFRTGG